jgi:hypothetical protein
LRKSSKCSYGAELWLKLMALAPVPVFRLGSNALEVVLEEIRGCFTDDQAEFFLRRWVLVRALEKGSGAAPEWQLAW